MAPDIYPLNTAIFCRDFEIELLKPLTIIVGENGSGKSTLLEIIAHHCGFNTQGGSRNNYSDTEPDIAPAMNHLRFSWMPRVTSGFFMRAESFFNFANNLDNMAKEYGAEALEAYGGKSLNEQSHGEAFLSLFSNRIGQKGIYIFDEPEAALSPEKQFSFIKIISDMARSNNSQIIMATHSPILMSIPGADVLHINQEGEIYEKSYKALPHWNLYSRFMSNPERYLSIILDD